MNENNMTDYVTEFETFLNDYRNEEGELNDKEISEAIIAWSYENESEDYNIILTYLNLMNKDTRNKTIDKMSIDYIENFDEWQKNYEDHSTIVS